MKRQSPGLRAALGLRAIPLILAAASIAGARADASKKPQGDLPAPPSEVIVEPGGAKTSAGGRITVEKPTVDAGDVVRGQLATAVFEIKNTGTGTLKILSAKPG